MKTIKVRYFALFREAAGKSEETVETAAESAEGLYHELVSRYDFNISAEHVRLSINNCYQKMTDSVHQGDEVVFIPPVAGG